MYIATIRHTFQFSQARSKKVMTLLEKCPTISKGYFKTALKVFITTTLVVVFFAVYFTDVWMKYKSEVTTFNTQRKIIDSNTWPSLTICISNAFKSKVLKDKVGTAKRRIFVDDGYHSEKNNVSIWDLFFEAAYKLDQDFVLNLVGGEKNDRREVKLKLGDNNGVVVEEMPTERRGLCYNVINVEAALRKQEKITIGVEPLNDSLKGVNIFLTSINTRHNCILQHWPFFRPFATQKKFELRFLVNLQIREVQWKFYGGNANCNQGCGPEQCLNENVLLSASCKVKCLPVVLLAFYRNSSLPKCHSSAENACMFKHFEDYYQSADHERCEKPESDTQFIADEIDDYFLDMPEPKKTVYIGLEHPEKKETIKKEIRIYDEASLIGSLGGTLGLFIGFSFLGVLNYLFDRIFTLI